MDRVVGDTDTAQLCDVDLLVRAASTCQAAQDRGGVETLDEPALVALISIAVLWLDTNDMDLRTQACHDEVRAACAAHRGRAEREGLRLEVLETFDAVEVDEALDLRRVQVDGVEAAARRARVLVGHDDPVRERGVERHALEVHARRRIHGNGLAASLRELVQGVLGDHEERPPPRVVHDPAGLHVERGEVRPLADHAAGAGEHHRLLLLHGLWVEVVGEQHRGAHRANECQHDHQHDGPKAQVPAMWVGTLDLPQALEIDVERVQHPEHGHDVQRRASPCHDVVCDKVAQALQTQGDGDERHHRRDPLDKRPLIREEGLRLDLGRALGNAGLLRLGLLALAAAEEARPRRKRGPYPYHFGLHAATKPGRRNGRRAETRLPIREKGGVVHGIRRRALVAKVRLVAGQVHGRTRLMNAFRWTVVDAHVDRDLRRKRGREVRVARLQLLEARLPIRQLAQPAGLVVEAGDAVRELRELVQLVDQAAAEELLDPLRLPLRQLDLEDRPGKGDDLLAPEARSGHASAPAARFVRPHLVHKGELRVNRDAHGVRVGALERRPLVDGPHLGHQRPVLDLAPDLVREGGRGERGVLRRGMLSHPREEQRDRAEPHGEALLDAALLHPAFVVRLPLDKHLAVVRRFVEVAVPPQAEEARALLPHDAAVVQGEGVVVQVDRGEPGFLVRAEEIFGDLAGGYRLAAND
mmetsp:Transcript_7187/g.19312  ORF Transcript_7187/g.19312 Transcript_7187/m.19312 type:complete len:698 (+) Transcript_7187:358-2451(+)